MGEAFTLGAGSAKTKDVGRFFAGVVSLALLLVQLPASWAGDWKASLKQSAARLEERYPEQLGLYVKELATGEEFSLRADDTWYLASGVKVPIALEVLRQVDQGKISLATKVRLRDSDYVDGAGETNNQKPGSLLSVRYLIEQMLIHSDNTASDLLIQLAGLKEINNLVRSVVPRGFSEITSLSDVRRHAYSSFHPSAYRRMTNRDFMLLKAIPDEKEKLKKLAELLDIGAKELRLHDLDAAYSAYYAKKLNSADLRSYGLLLERAFAGMVVGPSSTRFLVDTMTRVETGAGRIKAGLPRTFVFAHKTGTQHARICDFGIAWDAKAPERKVVIAACGRDFMSSRSAEKALSELGEAVHSSGVFATAD